VEFDDGAPRRPSALAPRAAFERLVQKAPPRQRIEIVPNVGASSTGFSIGGKF
jgi:hypothetical protein